MSSMCYTNDARSPLPPIVGGSTDEGDLVLTATDGNRFRAYAARAAAPSGAGVVVIPDPRGVHPFYKDLVSRFAQAGVDAIVIDYIDRTAGMSEQPENFDLPAAIGKTNPDAIAAAGAPGGGGGGVGVPGGFCFWRRAAWGRGCVQPWPAGAIGFYGIPSRVRDAI